MNIKPLGFRSFAISALLGAVCFYLALKLELWVPYSLVPLVLFPQKSTHDPGVTTELAFIMTYFIGHFAFGIFRSLPA